MKLYNSNFSPNALRVRAVAAELGIPLDIVEVDLRKGENKTASYLAINPNGKVPVLVDGDFVLWESRAINGYLASLRPEHVFIPMTRRSAPSSTSGPTGRPSISAPPCRRSRSSG